MRLDASLQSKQMSVRAELAEESTGTERATIFRWCGTTWSLFLKKTRAFKWFQQYHHQFLDCSEALTPLNIFGGTLPSRFRKAGIGNAVDYRIKSLRLKWKSLHLVIPRKKKKKKHSGSVRFRLCDGGWRNSLLFHPVGLRTQDKTKKVVIWNSGSCVSSSWSGTSLIVQPGALKQCNRVEFWPLTSEYLHLKCNIWVLFVSPDILRACQKTPRRPQVARRSLQGTGKTCLCWRPGLHREKSISYSLSSIFSWLDWNAKTCWEDWICAGGGVYMRRVGGAET